jgi:hypothetical protein
LTLLPSKPTPFRADAARGELLRLWEGLNLEGRRQVLANAGAVAEVSGKLQHQPDAMP